MSKKEYDAVADYAFRELEELKEGRNIVVHAGYLTFYNVFVPAYHAHQDHYRLITKHEDLNHSIKSIIAFLQKRYKTRDYQFWFAQALSRYSNLSPSGLKIYLNAVYFTLDSEQHGFDLNMIMNEQRFSDLYDQYLYVFLLANPSLGKEKKRIAALAINDALHVYYYHNIENNKDYFVQKYLKEDTFRGIDLFRISELSKDLYMKIIHKVPESRRLPVSVSELIFLAVENKDIKVKPEQLEELVSYWCYLASKIDLLSPYMDYRYFGTSVVQKIYENYFSSPYCVVRKGQDTKWLMDMTEGLLNMLIDVYMDSTIKECATISLKN